VNSAANESVHTLSGAYVVDALDDDERQAFETHLPGCRDCQAEVASLREAAALMADDAALTPPPSLRASVLAGISTVRPLPPEVPESPVEAPASAVVVPLHRRRRFRAATLAAAAAVLAIIGVGAVVQPWQDQNPPVASISPADRVLAADDATHASINFDDGSKATVVRSLSEGKAVLVTRDMAAPPSGKTYEVWFQDHTGHMVPAGLMTSPGDNKVLLDGDATKATGVGITVEPAGGSPQPTSNPIALLELDKADT
jgi:anti-sigma-K factor RskA